MVLLDSLINFIHRVGPFIWPLLAVTAWSLIGSIVRARSARRTGPLSAPVRPGEWWRRPILVALVGLLGAQQGLVLAMESRMHYCGENYAPRLSAGLSVALLSAITGMVLCAVTALWAGCCALWSRTAAGQVGAALCLVLAFGAVTAASGLHILRVLFEITAGAPPDLPSGALFRWAGTAALLLPLPLLWRLRGDLALLPRGLRGVWGGTFAPLTVLLIGGLSMLLSLRTVAIESAWESLLVVTAVADVVPTVERREDFDGTHLLSWHGTPEYGYGPADVPAAALQELEIEAVLACLEEREAKLSPRWEAMFPTAALDCGVVRVEPEDIGPGLTLQEAVENAVLRGRLKPE